MATRRITESKIPIPIQKKENDAPILKGSNPPKQRHLSLVESNIRNGSRSSISSISEEQVVNPKTRKLSTKGDEKLTGSKKQRKRRSPRVKKISSHTKGNQSSPAQGSQQQSRPATPLPAGRNSLSLKGSLPPPSLKIVSEDETPSLPEDVINIDIEDGMYEYSKELIFYLKELEKKFVLKKDYLDGGSISQPVRATLVDWLIQVQHHLKLCQESLYRCIIILDTILSRRDINGGKLQLVGITALLMSSKLEEYYPADINKLVHLTDNSYTVKQVLRMEMVLLEVLDFQLYFPEIMSFLRRYVRAALRAEDKIFMKTCQYLLDSTLVNYSFNTKIQSLQAAACVLATNCLFAVSASQDLIVEEVWFPTLSYYTSYSFEDLAPLAIEMLKYIAKPEYAGTFDKYKSLSQHQRLVLQPHLATQIILKALSKLKSLIQLVTSSPSISQDSIVVLTNFEE